LSLLLQQSVNGVALGSIYALVALGLTLVYGVLGVPNFSHGALYTVGAYLTWVLVSSLGMPYAGGMAVSVIAVGLLGIAMERLAFRPLQGASAVRQMIVALGLLFFIEGGVDAIWGAEFRLLPPPFEGVVTLAGVNLTRQRLLVIGAAMAGMILLHLFLKGTAAGRTVRATAQDPEGARLVGIDTHRVAALTFAISGALAALAGGLVAPILLISPHMGEVIILKAFVIVVLGGMGSVPGAIAGAYFLGMAETLAGSYIAFAFSELIAFALLVVVLAVRPQGFFGRQS